MKSKSLKTLHDLEIQDVQIQKEHRALKTTSLAVHPSLPAQARTLRYIGSVTRVTTERILKDITCLMNCVEKGVKNSSQVENNGQYDSENVSKEIALFVSSPGGTTGIAMSFYDTVRYILKPDLVTIGSGDVDSSGVIIFLSGTKRYVTARTTMLLHPAGRIFGNQRYTTQEMEAMLSEDKLKDEQYAEVIANNSKGRLTRDAVLMMMHAHTVLSPSKMVEFGLADAILA